MPCRTNAPFHWKYRYTSSTSVWLLLCSLAYCLNAVPVSISLAFAFVRFGETHTEAEAARPMSWPEGSRQPATTIQSENSCSSSHASSSGKGRRTANTPMLRTMAWFSGAVKVWYVDPKKPCGGGGPRRPPPLFSTTIRCGMVLAQEYLLW